MVRASKYKKVRKTMRIAICDDMPQFNRLLKDKIENICALKDWSLESLVYSSPNSILAADLSNIQVVFLDIDMPELNGLEVAKALRKKYPKIILIFVTAYIEYAPEGYHVAAFRYLLKQKLDRDLGSVMDDVQQKLYESSETLEIRQKSGTKEIPLSSILYLEGTSNRMVLFHISESEKPLEEIGRAHV